MKQSHQPHHRQTTNMRVHQTCMCARATPDTERERERERELRKPFSREEYEGGQWKQGNQQQPQRESPVSPLARVDDPFTKPSPPTVLTNKEREREREEKESDWAFGWLLLHN
jgi:hypothetical protein